MKFLPKVKISQNGVFSPVVIIVAVVIALAAGGYFFFSKNSSSPRSGGNNIIDQIKKTPYSELESAINKTVNTKTAYIDYKTKVTSRITGTAKGITQTLVNHVDGYMTGSTNGDITKAEMRISSDANPKKSVIVDVIAIKNSDMYVEGPATKGKWQKLTKAEQEAASAKNPTDASLYGFNILGTIFSDNKALFKTIKKESVEKLPDYKTDDGKVYSKFSVDISVVDYVKAIGEDKNVTDKDKKDAQAILGDAILKATFSVDQKTDYVTGIAVEARNLAQISTPASEKLGISTKHDLDLNAELSRFDVPTGVTIPEDKDLLEPDKTT